jgi:hypothetical protein
MRAGFYDHTESGMVIKAIANSSGIAQGYLGPVPEGYCWYVERESTWSTGSAGECEIFVVTTHQMPSGMTAAAGDRAGRQDVSLLASDDISDNNSPIFVGPGYYLVAFWTGLTNLDQVILSTQIVIHRLSLLIEDPAQVVQQVEPTPDINAEDVQESDSIVDELVHATADAFKSMEKAL